jgi:hypothetical protein
MTPIPTYAALLAFMRAQLDRLQMSTEVYDHHAGWADGSAATVLNGHKHFSGPSLFLALNALGCTLLVVEDPASVARIKKSSKYKLRADNVVMGMRQSPVVRRRIRKFTMLLDDTRVNGRNGGLARAKLGPKKLSKINRKAALTRWRQARKAAVI